MVNSRSTTPDRDDVLTQQGDISVASTSDSGKSDDVAPRRSRGPIPGSVGAVVPSGVPTTCTMCDVAVSEFTCAQCGRLSFCLKCSISLHDNKFLGGHKLALVGGGTIHGIGTATPQEHALVSELKFLQQSREAPPTRIAPPPRMSEDIDVEPTRKYRGDAGLAPERVSHAAELTEEQQVALNSDRRLLRARLAELARCGDIIKATAAKAAHEKGHSAEATKTAFEAVRRRFDVLRQVIDAKEKEYFEVIEAAGQKRLDEAARTATAATVAATETEAFVKLMTTQVNRLEGNNKQFFDCRRQMLDEVEARTKSVDSTVSELDRTLASIHSISMGVPVQLGAAVEAVQSLQPPVTLLMHYAVVHHDPIPAEKFAAEPGVRVWSSDGTLVSKGDPADIAALVPTPRKSLAQQVQELKTLPMPSARGQSPVRAATPHRNVSPPRSQAPTVGSPISQRAPLTTSTAPSPGTAAVRSDVMAKIAARSSGHGAINTSGAAGVFPTELETLKKHIAQRAAVRQHSNTNVTTAVPPTAAPSTTATTSAARYRQPIAVPQPTMAPLTRTSSSRASSPAAARGSSPVPRVATLVSASSTTPSKRAMSPTAAMRIRYGMGADVAANQPGPGSYFQQKAFNAPRVLSTPPRRA